MIVKTITDDYYFWNWLKKSDNYSNKFSLEGAKAVQAYLDELSEILDEPMEFDPIAWCCKFSEYESLAKAYKQHRWDYTYVEGEAREFFEDNTTILELDNGSVVIADF